MKNQWLEIRLTVPGEQVEAVAALLEGLGCAGVTLEQKTLDTFDPPATDAPDPGGPLSAYLETSDDEAEVLRRARAWLAPLRQVSPGLGDDLSVRVVTTEDWAEGWKQHFPPLYIGERLLVLPTWEAVPQGWARELIRLDPGMAFGTGGHATTRLCLEAVATAMEMPQPPLRVLDVGTGSGILAIAAVRLGAKEVVACDIDPLACEVAAENCRLNGVLEKIHITLQPLQDLGGDFDLVLANILAEENVRLAGELVSRVRPGGQLVLSGILQEKEALVRQGFTGRGLAGPEIHRCEEWSCLLYRREA